MKHASVVFLSVAMAFLIGCVDAPQTTRDAYGSSSPFPYLDDYGVWFDFPPLGTVWQPRVPYDWRPFTDGRWIWTDRGWFWDTPEPFGWIVYHYGSWTYQRDAGWLWVPGYEWSPARVRWYEDATVIGWAPLPPAGIDPQGSDWGWVTIQPHYFVLDNVVRHVARGNRPTGNRRPEDERRPPDVKTIEQAASRRIEKLRTESEDVRSGQKQVKRVRVDDRTPSLGAPTPSVGGTGTNPNGVVKPPDRGTRTIERTPEVRKESEKRQEKTPERAPEPKKETEKVKEKSQERPATPPARDEKTGDRAPEPKKETGKEEEKKPARDER